MKKFVATDIASSYSRRSAGILVLVGVLAGVTVGGGVGVIAASSTKTVTVCANKKTNVLRYAKNNRCASTETKVTLNQTGEDGVDGVDGVAGAAGAKGDAGAAGAAGAVGAAGAAGAKGDAGVNATVAITQQSVCDGSDTGTVANELCKIGMTGPGGGIVFFVDYNDQYTGLDYLEAAPVGWGNGIAVSPIGIPGSNEDGSLVFEDTGTSTVDPLMQWCSNTSSLLGSNAFATLGVGTGGSNTSTADITCTGGAIQAVSDYAGGSKTDWFLPSLGEAMLMDTNLRQAGVGGLDSFAYWSSSEADADYSRMQFFSGGKTSYPKAFLIYVRPVRAF